MGQPTAKGAEDGEKTIVILFQEKLFEITEVT